MLKNKSWRLAVVRALSLAGKPLSGGEEKRLGNYEFIQWQDMGGMLFLAPPLCNNEEDVVVINCMSKLQILRFKWMLRGKENYFAGVVQQKHIKETMKALACK